MEEIKKERKPNLSKKKWTELRAAYEGTDETLKVLAKTFGTHPSTISKKADREEWSRPRARKDVYAEARLAAITREAEETVTQASLYAKEQTKNIEQAKSVLIKQLIIYDTISQIDALKMKSLADKARPYLASGNVSAAHAIMSKSNINREAPYKIKTIIDGLCCLDIAERRLLGLDNITNPEKFKDDPMLAWVDDIEKARKKYLKVLEVGREKE